jgi:hypothetical protein
MLRMGTIITLLFMGIHLSVAAVASSQATNEIQLQGRVEVIETANTPALLTDEQKQSTQNELKSSPSLNSIAPLAKSSDFTYPSTAYWFYDSEVDYLNDPDYDGYFSGFALTFDIDTVYSAAPVYAVVYLGTNDNYQAIYVTQVFYLYGDSSDDTLVLENNLMSGFPSHDYDLLIEVFDANSDELLITADYYTDSDLSYVSLESSEHEIIYSEPGVVIVTEHGGSLSAWILVIGLMFSLSLRLLRQHKQKP